MGVPEVNNEEREDKNHLSVSFNPGRGRSSSRSSARTIVADNPDLEGRRAAIKRRQTQVVLLEEPSWLDCFKALFPFGRTWLKRKLVAGSHIEDVKDDLREHEEPYDHNECPYILTVLVYPREGAQVQARCVLDTGCLQGNIISAAFAQDLGFTNEDFQGLTEREKKGGTVATGNIHTVSGAVHVAWYHFSSPKIFQNMRFLVSESAQVDLIIGCDSIVRHNLVSLPNLSSMIDMNLEGNKKREELASTEAQLEIAVKKAERELKDAKTDAERGAKEKDLRKKQKKHKIAAIELKKYDAEALLRRSTKETAKQALRDTIAGLEAELKSMGKQHKGSQGKSDPKL